MEKKRLTFLGTLYPDDAISQLLEDTIGNLSFAGDTYQKALLKGFEDKRDVRVFSALQIGSFPKRFKRLDLSLYTKYSDNKIKIVPYFNLTFFKTFSIKYHLTKCLKKITFEKREEIIVYSMDYSLIASAVTIKKQYPNVHIHLIITDICEYMSPGKFAKIINKFWQKKIMKMFSYVDSFTVMTRYMIDKLNINKPCAIVEGINNMVFKKYSCTQNRETFIVLYTGTLEKRYGIIHLLNSFNLLPTTDNYQLWICGNGDAKEVVEELAKKDSRIKYYGLIPREKVLKLQQEADLLINPRFSTDEYTLYSFPSKTIEYMLSSTPVLMHRLPGIPDEYEPYIFYGEDESDEGFAKKIYEISQMDRDVLRNKGELAKTFILENKNCYKQVEKIIEVLK